MTSTSTSIPATRTAAAQDWAKCGTKSGYDHHRREVSWVDASGTGIWTAPDMGAEDTGVVPDFDKAAWSAAAEWHQIPW